MDGKNVKNNSYSNGGGRPTYNGKNHRPPVGCRTSPAGESGWSQQEELINYIFDSWDKISSEFEQDGGKVKYFQSSRQFPALPPFDLDAWWGRRRVQGVKRQQHSS